MSAMLVASDLSKSYEDRTVLAHVDLAVDPGHRVGLVGENGVGKSTLLRLIAGVEDPDSGSVDRPVRLGYLHQEAPYRHDAVVGDVIDAALADVRALTAELEAAAAAVDAAPDDARDAAAARYAAVLVRAEAADVWGADVRVARTLAGLDVADLGRDRRIAFMSGGQRTRLGLAALLIRQPEALVLDEPTNHLDDGAAEFLADALRALPGAVLFASHDRVFLQEVATEIVDLDPTREATAAGRTATTWYGGGYRDYLTAKAKERRAWQAQYEAEQEELATLRESVRVRARQVGHEREMTDRNKMAYGKRGDRVEGQVSRRVRNARTRLETLEAEQVPRPPVPLRFTPPSGRALKPGPDGEAPVVLEVRRGVVQGRLDLLAAGQGRLRVRAGDRLLVTGTNGAGKSTLLHVLAGDIPLTSGSLHRADGVEVALLEQDLHLAGEKRSPRELLTLMAGARASDRVRDFGLVAARDLNRRIGDLSVGQRRRVVLAMIVMHSPHVLLLDEPTNHLSLTLAEELMEALEGWPGAVVVASHDRWLRRRWKGTKVHLPPQGTGR
ncbi:macrolide transport system ATP-binding/permease protein [Flavimobilis soli]|uniref:Macrolide transport system ATP-binding/permease protein n=2 Tax=Flavimobilis soli TaxID=442709 RepID=A0A2A9EF05_9MICO|nr:macrolide transport system ATP-binding/permease protein [Flavimobilis soli]